MESILSVIVSVCLLVELMGSHPETKQIPHRIFVDFPVMWWISGRVDMYIRSLLGTSVTTVNVIRSSMDETRRLPARSDWSETTDLDGIDLAEYYDVVCFFLCSFKRIVFVLAGGVLRDVPSFLMFRYNTQPDEDFDARLRRLGAFAMVIIGALCTCWGCVGYFLNKYCVYPWHAKLVEKCRTQPRSQLLHNSLLGSSLVCAFFLLLPSVPHFSFRWSLAVVHTGRVLNVCMGLRGPSQRAG